MVKKNVRASAEGFWVHSSSLITCHSPVSPSLIFNLGDTPRTEVCVVDIVGLKRNLEVYKTSFSCFKKGVHFSISRVVCTYIICLVSVGIAVASPDVVF